MMKESKQAASSIIEGYLRTLNDETSLSIPTVLKENSSLQVGWLRLCFTPFIRFVRSYIRNRGFRNGVKGFVEAMLDSMYTLAELSKIWEYRFREREGKGLLPPTTKKELEQFNRLSS